MSECGGMSELSELASGSLGTVRPLRRLPGPGEVVA